MEIPAVEDTPSIVEGSLAEVSSTTVDDSSVVWTLDTTVAASEVTSDVFAFSAVNVDFQVIILARIVTVDKGATEAGSSD